MPSPSGAQAFDQSDLPDDDPDVVAGMERLKLLRAGEGDVPEIGAR